MFENRIPLKTAQRFRAMPYYADIRPMTEVGILNLSRYAKRLMEFRVFEALSIALFYGTMPEFKLTDFFR